MRIVAALALSLVITAVVFGTGAAGGFLLLVMLNGFPESTGAVVLVGYAAVVVAVDVVVVARVWRAMLAGSSGAAGGIGAAVAAALGLALLAVGAVASWLMLRTPQTSSDGFRCRKDLVPVEAVSDGSFACGQRCDDDDDCQRQWRCVDGHVVDEQTRVRSGTAKYCRRVE